ncbi:sodium/calcium exchanger regulatory protein 1-like [Diadema antillarum]|uniref:sodium/calcium exchanger regulatory protein 1-like n=1 Tax=Diadema antillarum TaxID=105358 RepID=UPI003A8BD7F4
MDVVDMSGEWELVSSENMDAFLKACGVGMIHRTMAARVSPTVYIKQSGMESFEITTSTRFRDQKLCFTVDQAFRSTIPWEDSEREMLARWEDGRLVIRVVGDVDGSEPVFARYLQGDQLVLAQSKKGVEAKRFFRKIVNKT